MSYLKTITCCTFDVRVYACFQIQVTVQLTLIRNIWYMSPIETKTNTTCKYVSLVILVCSFSTWAKQRWRAVESDATDQYFEKRIRTHPPASAAPTSNGWSRLKCHGRDRCSEINACDQKTHFDTVFRKLRLYMYECKICARWIHMRYMYKTQPHRSTMINTCTNRIHMLRVQNISTCKHEQIKNNCATPIVD